MIIVQRPLPMMDRRREAVPTPPAHVIIKWNPRAAPRKQAEECHLPPHETGPRGHLARERKRAN